MRHPQKVPKARRNPARRKLLYLGAALGLSLALVLLLPQIKGLFPAVRTANLEGERQFRVLDQTDPQELERIFVTHESGESYTLGYRQGLLVLERPGREDVPIDPALAEKILEAATDISVQDIVTQDREEVREHLADMGLAPPHIQVEVRYQSGRQDTLSFGWKVPETGFYYLLWSGDPGVYMCDQGMYQPFDYTAQALLPVERVALEKALIDRITLEMRGREPITLRFIPQEGQKAALESPFAYPLEETAVQGLLTAAAQFRLGALREDITWENRGEYGFDDPLAQVEIHQQAGNVQQEDAQGGLISTHVPEQTLKLALGQKTGDFFYTCQYNGRYYDVSILLVETFVQTTLEGLLSQYPADLGEAELACILVRMRGKTLELRKEKAERVLPNNELAMDVSGNLLYDAQVFLNGEPAPQEVFDTLVRRLAGMRVTGPVEEGFAPKEATPRWELVLTTQEGAVRTLAAYGIDPFSDAIALDGVIRHRLQGEALEIALGELLEEGGGFEPGESMP